MAELMARQSSVQVLTKVQIIEGTIKKLTPSEILMDIGAKGDALVIEFDRQNLENLLAYLKVGDRVKASVISPESEDGFPVLSLRRTLDNIIFEKFEDLIKSDKPFEVDITESTRGGYYAQTEQGVKGFMPASQVIDSDIVGKKIKVKIIEFDRAKKRVVFSQKAISLLMNPAQIAEYVKSGDVIDAEVTSVTPYGLYVLITPKKAAGKPDVAIEGFVHISEIAYERVENLSERFKVGDKIKPQVMDIDSTNKRVNLSIKKTKKDMFTQVREKYKAEEKVKATVTDVKSRGVTLSISEGINGFIPADKISSGTTYEKGQSIEALIVDFDDRRRVIILSPVLKSVPIGYR